ncbi:hypothetical protein GGF32_008962 [Allomyces javanicus]|nr:hypothetical protein GGF32_008962 [Allomyces javanicus]
MTSYEEGLRIHQQQLQAHQQAEQDLIRLQQQQAAMNAGGYLPPPPQPYRPPASPPPLMYQPPPLELRGIVLEIIEARNLKDVEIFGDIDPFTTVEFGGKKLKTRAHKDAGCNPRLGDTLEFMAPAGVNEMVLEVWDSNKYNFFTGDTFIGRARIDISDLRRGQEFLDRWIPLTDDGNGAAGEIHIKFVGRY